MPRPFDSKYQTPARAMLQDIASGRTDFSSMATVSNRTGPVTPNPETNDLTDMKKSVMVTPMTIEKQKTQVIDMVDDADITPMTPQGGETIPGVNAD